MASYLLSCGCGNKLVVEPRQAGESVRCVCGTDLEVPTMRTLNQLPRADAASDTAGSVWTPREGLIFLGLVVTACALALTAYFYVNRPVLELAPPVRLEDLRQQINGATLWETWQYWGFLASGLHGDEMRPENVVFEQALRIRQRRMLAAVAIAVCGLLVAGGAALAGKRTQKAEGG